MKQTIYIALVVVIVLIGLGIYNSQAKNDVSANMADGSSVVVEEVEYDAVMPVLEEQKMPEKSDFHTLPKENVEVAPANNPHQDKPMKKHQNNDDNVLVIEEDVVEYSK